MNSVPMSELVKNSDTNAIHTISMNILRIIIIIDFVFFADLQFKYESADIEMADYSSKMKGVGGCFS